MGFADYLTRNPSQTPPPPSSDDTQFIINTINNFKYILLKDTIDKMKADKYQTSDDIIQSKAHTAQKTNAFYQTRNINQSIAHITTYKSSNTINPIQSNPFNSSIYKSSIESSTKSSNSKLSIKSSNCKNSLSNYKSSKIYPIQSKSNPPIPHSPDTTLNPANFAITTPYSKFQKIFVTTRSNQKVETLLQPFQKRKRAPNKPK